MKEDLLKKWEEGNNKKLQVRLENKELFTKAGEEMIYEERKAIWGKFVESQINKPNHGDDLISTLKVMKALHQNDDMLVAIETLDNENLNKASFDVVMNAVAAFSKRGPAFYREVINVNEETNELLKQLEKDNARFENNLKNKEKTL